MAPYHMKSCMPPRLGSLKARVVWEGGGEGDLGVSLSEDRGEAAPAVNEKVVAHNVGAVLQVEVGHGTPQGVVGRSAGGVILRADCVPCNTVLTSFLMSRGEGVLNLREGIGSDCRGWRRRG